MLSLLQTLKSRTVWTAIAGLAFNAWNQASGHVDPTIANIVNTAIALGVSIFRAFPKQGNNPS